MKTQVILVCCTVFLSLIYSIRAIPSDALESSSNFEAGLLKRNKRDFLWMGQLMGFCMAVGDMCGPSDLRYSRQCCNGLTYSAHCLFDVANQGYYCMIDNAPPVAAPNYMNPAIMGGGY